MTDASTVGVNLGGLIVPAGVRRGVGEFIDEVLAIYKQDLLSIFAFGSAVTGEYEAGESDLNLIVVHGSLDIEDLDRVGALSRRWLRTQMLAPRFLSKRNFDDYLRHFQVDLLAMRHAAAVLWGQDLLAAAPMRPAELRWQSVYEIKAMRLRIKQQFWRVADDPAAMRRVLIQRFASLTHLMRAALALRALEAPARRSEVVAAAITHLGINPAFTQTLSAMREQHTKPEREILVAMFGDLLDAIRAVDAAIGEPTV